MGRHEKLLARIARGDSDASIHFDQLRAMLVWLGFEERISGSHHVLRFPTTPVLLTLQRDRQHAKVYQVRQVRRALLELRILTPRHSGDQG